MEQSKSTSRNRRVTERFHKTFILERLKVQASNTMWLFSYNEITFGCSQAMVVLDMLLVMRKTYLQMSNESLRIRIYFLLSTHDFYKTRMIKWGMQSESLVVLKR